MNARKLSREDTVGYQQKLQAIVDCLCGDVAQLTDEATRLLGSDEPEAAGEDAASAGVEEARSVLMTEAELLAEVWAALDRIHAGVFGFCTRCDRPLSKSRLNAVPYARLCMTCARALVGDAY